MKSRTYKLEKMMKFNNKKVNELLEEMAVILTSVESTSKSFRLELEKRKKKAA